jgi:hypothetical protein
MTVEREIEWKGCDFCDSPGGSKTYENQRFIPVNGRVVAIDHCIHHLVAALNAGYVKTFSSCCGHGTTPGSIILDDGRVLMVFRDRKHADTHWRGPGKFDN